MRIEGRIMGAGVGACSRCTGWFRAGDAVVVEQVSHGDALDWNARRIVHKECPQPVASTGRQRR